MLERQWQENMSMLLIYSWFSALLSQKRQIILNNKELAMISVEQKVEGYPKFATNLKNPDFADYAISCGGVGFKVKKPNELKDAFEKAIKAKKPAIVDIETDPKRF
jgi:pyruvate oxidase